ncbi:MAG: polysaccharide pyruvyl transferase family protein [Clostridia bacterium]
MKDKILIFGAHFGNTGAEAMLYVTINEMIKRFPEKEIVVLYPGASCDKNLNNYKFVTAEDNIFARYFAIEQSLSFAYIKGKAFQDFKNIVKFVLGKQVRKYPLKHIDKYIKEAYVVIDISGYALATTWGEKVINNYIYMYKSCEKHNVPLYLMPQSFGPFNLSESLMSDIKDLFNYSSLVFVREEDGKKEIENNFNFKESILSTDLVLQNKFVDYNLILKNISKKEVNIKTKTNNVAILPNMRVFDRLDNDILLDMYKKIINELLRLEKNVYILRHSAEDLLPAKLIKNSFANNDKVVLIESQFNSYQYEEVVQNFDYIIASRYHSIVHAYKHDVPCIAIGWAVKYHELLTLFEQNAYMVDIRDEIKTNEIIDKIIRIDSNYKKEKILINNHLVKIQENNCFDLLEDNLKNRGI